MKRLEKLVLINWHYIVHEVLNLQQITFLTGKNGAGKSTILDALQMLILGDTSGHFFNKAANDNSRRSLKGYLFGEVADAEDSGIVYLRADETFSSYVVAEFYDTVKKKHLCMGIIFDCDPDGTYNHRFFSLLDELPSFHFIREETPLSIQELRQWGSKKGKGKFELYETNKRYQDMFRSHMGNIGEKFFRLFRKAVPFSPIMDVAGFISEFVCDVEHRLDIEDMRENIRHYRRMEDELRHVRKKVDALTQIGQQAESLSTVEERLQVYQYLVDRAKVVEIETQLEQLEHEVLTSKHRLSELHQEIKRHEERQIDLQNLRDTWRDERVQSDIFVKQQSLENKKQLLHAEFVSIFQSIQRQERMLLDLSARWSAVAAGVKQALSWEQWITGDTQDDLSADIQAASSRIGQAMQMLRKPVDLSGVSLNTFDPTSCELNVDEFADVQLLLANAANSLGTIHRKIADELARLNQEQAELKAVIAELKKGIKPYDRKVTELQRAIMTSLRTKTGADIPVTIFAEALEIPDPTWHRAIEGYLHTQRFYLLVPPEYFQLALEVYDSVKREQHIYDVGIVDIGRILEQKPERLSGSLAEEIETEDAFARVYADFLLGRVMKVEKIEQLRNHRTAVTADGMLYQNYVARQMDPKRWENLFIGKRALAQQLELKSARLAVVEELVEMWSPRVQSAAKWASMTPPSEGDLRDVGDAQRELIRVPVLQTELRQVLHDLGSLDLSYLLDLDDKIRDCEKQIKQVEQQKEHAISEKTKLEIKLDQLEGERRRKLEMDRNEAAKNIEDSFTGAFVMEKGEPRFQQEMQRLGSPTTILFNFGRQMQVDRNRKDTLWTELVKLRADFNRDFQAGFDIQRADNEAYQTELQRLIDSQLTEYEEKIRQAKERAQIQFQEDFVSKLQSNIYTVESQIRELNAALKGISFGRDQYRFQITPNAQYLRFYQMIMDELLMEGYGLFSQSFQEKHGEVVEELFRNIIDVDETDPYAMTELEKNLEKFTDYRTYLNFDLIVKDEEGRESRLSRVIAKKSGGETQTPFYISVLASFMQLYRVGRPGTDNTLRLIVFDEAYSKMDHQRIRESIRLIHDLGLQVILSAPTEKLADIAPLVDRTLIVTRIQSQTKVLEFDMAKEKVSV
ncbi:AAA family ATPase [Fodinisporobacter ferrooxydans]|uniref:AAA family ATPase n=1 Tax=Fodinisporobacter ferrooxydans TaxID=2901836 RepID=A0ABY4CL33_9BACL|nr:AAA family ATPase [Alicyclobacillaceae bacterium MYW30-H2]